MIHEHYQYNNGPLNAEHISWLCKQKQKMYPWVFFSGLLCPEATGSAEAVTNINCTAHLLCTQEKKTLLGVSTESCGTFTHVCFKETM